MNKTKLGVLFVISLLVISGITIANSGKNGKGDHKRVIADTTSLLDKVVFRMKGCSIVHELRDATALKCPAAVAATLDVREDKIYRLIDLKADKQINADDVWALGYDGTGTMAAILDTGIDTDHQELADSIMGCESFVPGIASCEDDHGHGTHVAGIITANGVDANAKGVAHGAGIIMGKVCGPIGTGYGCYDSDIEAGIEWAVAQGADVISISLGSYEVYTGEDCDWADDPVAIKVNLAVGEGVAVVAAAGNDGLPGVSSPACASGAIAVGAVDSRDKVARFSNFGDALDIVAPGVRIYSTYLNNGYTKMSGTSMATPHVSGVVALILDKNSALTVDQIKAALYNTAKDLKGDKDGNGRVDALGAVNYVSEACTSNAECDDSNECTADVCNPDGTCSNTAVADNTACTGGICCSGTCSVATCSADADCDDAEACTTDTCSYAGTCDAYCSYEEITTCSGDISDGCCPAGCDSATDIDCPEEPVCGNGIIEGTEECDGADLGEATCETLGFDDGTLACTETCTFDTSGCTSISPQTCSEYCVGLDKYSSGDCKKKCNTRKGEFQEEFPCSNARLVCCCKS